MNCPECNNDSLEQYYPLQRHTDCVNYDKHFSCILKCGFEFGYKKLKNGKIKIGVNNEKYFISAKKVIKELALKTKRSNHE